MRSEEMIKLLPSGLREVLQKMNLDVAGLQEIRLRAEQPELSACSIPWKGRLLAEFPSRTRT